MRAHTSKGLGVLMILLLTAAVASCQAFDRVDLYGTAQAENAAFDDEISTMTAVAQEARFVAAGTLEAGETAVARVNGVNQQLMATLQRQVTPTPRMENQGVQELDPTLLAQFAGRRLFVKTGTSTSINPADGCIVNPNVFFQETDTRIYGTLKVFNLNSGVRLRAEWKREGVPVWEDVWVVDRDYSEICVWFYIEPSYVAFTPGTWSVEMFADGFSLEGPMAFSIQPAMRDDS